MKNLVSLVLAVSLLSVPLVGCMGSSGPKRITMQHTESKDVVVLKKDTLVCKEILEGQGFQPVD